MARVRVPQKDGEIVITLVGQEPRHFPVSGGTIEASNEDALLLLGYVGGAELAPKRSVPPA